MESLPEELDSRIRHALDLGEKLLWAGQPRAARFLWYGLLPFLCGIPCAGVGGTLLWAAFTGNHDLPLWLGRALALCVALPTLLVGLWLLTSPYGMYRRARQTVYFVTDRRAIAWEAGWLGRIQARYFPLHMLRRMRCREHRGGNGDLVFDRVVTQEVDDEGTPRTRIVEHGFYTIDNVRHVEALIRDLLNSWE